MSEFLYWWWKVKLLASNKKLCNRITNRRIFSKNFPSLSLSYRAVKLEWKSLCARAQNLITLNLK